MGVVVLIKLYPNRIMSRVFDPQQCTKMVFAICGYDDIIPINIVKPKIKLKLYGALVVLQVISNYTVNIMAKHHNALHICVGNFANAIALI